LRLSRPNKNRLSRATELGSNPGGRNPLRPWAQSASAATAPRRPRSGPECHRGNVLAAGAADIVVYQGGTFCRGSRGRNPNQREFRHIGLADRPDKKRGLASLRMVPDNEARIATRVWHHARHTHRVYDRTRFADADEMRMRSWRAEARVIGSGDDVSALKQRPQPLNLLKNGNCLGTPVWVKPIGGIGSGCSDPE